MNNKKRHIYIPNMYSGKSMFIRGGGKRSEGSLSKYDDTKDAIDTKIADYWMKYAILLKKR